MKFFFILICMTTGLVYFLIIEDDQREEYGITGQETSSLELLKDKPKKRKEKIDYDRQIASIKEVVALDQKHKKAGPQKKDFNQLQDLTKSRSVASHSTEQKREKERVEALLDIEFDPSYFNLFGKKPPKKFAIPHCPPDQL